MYMLLARKLQREVQKERKKEIANVGHGRTRGRL